MASNEMISRINRYNYLRAYCEPATTNPSSLTQYCQRNAQQSTALTCCVKFEQAKTKQKTAIKTREDKKEKDNKSKQ